MVSTTSWGFLLPAGSASRQSDRHADLIPATEEPHHGDGGTYPPVSSVGIGIGAFVGMSIELDFLELADFVVGWFGLDPAGDDTPSSEGDAPRLPGSS